MVHFIVWKLYVNKVNMRNKQIVEINTCLSVNTNVNVLNLPEFLRQDFEKRHVYVLFARVIPKTQ